MNLSRIYLDKSTRELEEIENKYDFINTETPQYAALSSIDKSCLKTTKQIAKARENNLDTSNLERTLSEYRNYSIDNLLIRRW